MCWHGGNLDARSFHSMGARHSFYFDLLHNLFIGCANDFIGSVLLYLCEKKYFCFVGEGGLQNARRKIPNRYATAQHAAKQNRNLNENAQSCVGSYFEIRLSLSGPALLRGAPLLQIIKTIPIQLKIATLLFRKWCKRYRLECSTPVWDFSTLGLNPTNTKTKHPGFILKGAHVKLV
jgi:hypothetical protein